MSNLVKRLIGLLAAVGLAVGVIVLSWPQLATTRQTANSVPVGELVAGSTIGQTFHASFSGLYRIDVVLATYARQNQGPFTFHLSEGVEGPDLFTVEREAAQVRDNAFHEFVFDPIANSSGREFYFYLEAPNAAPGNAITVWQTDFDSYPGGQAYHNGRATEGDLTFVAYYRSSPREVWGRLTQRAQMWHPVLWRARWFVLGVAVALVIGFGVLLGELLVLEKA